MERSPSVVEALVGFFRSNASGDVSTFEDVVSAEDSILVVGSAAREWFAGREAVRGAYGLEGVGIEPGPIDAWENGQTAWAVCQPTFTVPGGSSFRLRVTAVFVSEQGRWKLVHLHGSYPVPDEVAMQHPEWWEPASSA